jgi:hypothetical protein
MTKVMTMARKNPASDVKRKRKRLRMIAERKHDPFAEFVDGLSAGAVEAVMHFGKAQQARPAKWFIVEVPDHGRALLHELGSWAEVRAKVVELVGSTSSVYVFYGLRSLLTKGNPRSLIHPNGMVYKLQPEEEDLLVDDAGYLGDHDDLVDLGNVDEDDDDFKFVSGDEDDDEDE